MHNVPNWSGTLKKSCSKYCKIFKVCLKILGHYALMVNGENLILHTAETLVTMNWFCEMVYSRKYFPSKHLLVQSQQ